MLGSQLKLTLNAMGSLVAEGDVRGLADYFECPLPIYMQDKFILFQCRDKIAEALAVFIVEAARCNVQRIEPVLVRVEDSTPNRSLFVVRWNHLRANGTCSYSNLVRYVGRRGDMDGRLRIELIEYLETGSAKIPAHLFGLVGA